MQNFRMFFRPRRDTPSKTIVYSNIQGANEEFALWIPESDGRYGLTNFLHSHFKKVMQKIPAKHNGEDNPWHPKMEIASEDCVFEPHDNRYCLVNISNSVKDVEFDRTTWRIINWEIVAAIYNKVENKIEVIESEEYLAIATATTEIEVLIVDILTWEDTSVNDDSEREKSRVTTKHGYAHY